MNSTSVTYHHLVPIVGWWAVGLIAAVVILVAAMLLASLWRLWCGRWPQFSLRAVFVAMTVSAVLAGCAAYLLRDVQIFVHDTYLIWPP